MTESAASPAGTAPASSPARWFNGLSFRLFAITVASILFVEGLIFVPSASKFRTNWIDARVNAARIAALALEAAPSRMVSQELSVQLLENAQVLSVNEIEDDMRFQLLEPAEPIAGDMYVVDQRGTTALQRSLDALGAFYAPEDRILMISDIGSAENRVIEVVVPQAPLRAEIRGFGRRIFGLSLLIALIAASLIYLLLHYLVVRPMQRVTVSLERFSDDPGGWTQSLPKTRRRDEIGRAQNALLDMETAVASSFRQRSRLAQLGEAVAKINHDLRNSLASAQLVSDSLSRSEDPRVQRAAPRLERALERAIKLATETLDYSKSEPPSAQIESINLHIALNEAAEEALAKHDSVAWENRVPDGHLVRADSDHLHRIASNLIRNAAEAMTASESEPRRVTATLDGVTLLLADTGPGLPDTAIENLFKPFAGSSRAKGSGLGLAIAKQLAGTMGGDVQLEDTSARGTVFRITLQGAHL